MRYRVWVRLEFEEEYSADNEHEAFLRCSEDATKCGSWEWEVEEIEGEDDEFDYT